MNNFFSGFPIGYNPYYSPRNRMRNIYSNGSTSNNYNYCYSSINSDYANRTMNKNINNSKKNDTITSSSTDIDSKKSRNFDISKNLDLPFNFNIDSILNGDIDSPILELLGIKLYLDDVLILGLLFILYKEEVKDEMLFATLFLLLLS